jgi:xeroderma pigmentosum group C-complementing protein
VTEQTGGGFVVEEDGGGGGFVLEDAVLEEDYGGGFVHDDDARDEEGGGGFIPEDHGGGFVIEEDHANAVDHDTGVAQPRTEQPHTEYVQGRKDDTSTPTTENQDTMQVESTEPDHSLLGPADDSNAPLNEDAAAPSRMSPNPTIADPMTLEATATSPPGNDASPEDDQESLLSHDPDDEDAEPDWLESD